MQLLRLAPLLVGAAGLHAPRRTATDLTDRRTVAGAGLAAAAGLALAVPPARAEVKVDAGSVRTTPGARAAREICRGRGDGRCDAAGRGDDAFFPSTGRRFALSDS